MFSRPVITPLLVVIATMLSTTRLSAQPALTYTGQTVWSQDIGTLTFETSGTMPNTKEGFFWNVPQEVKKIIIGENVTVKGAFRIGYRDRSKPLHIAGMNRKTSIIYGTDTPKWTGENNIPENDKWKYGSVSVLSDATVHITNLTAQNPRGYNISGYANQSVIHISQCNLLDTRPGNNNNSDGFVGAAGSSIRDSLISTSDDGIKIYNDISIEDVTIEQHRNGAPIQFGWGGNSGTAKATIKNLTIKGVDPKHLYNMAPFTWEGGDKGTRNVHIDGLTVQIKGEMYNEHNNTWSPIGLFELKPSNCTLNMQITNAKTNTSGPGRVNTKGSITIDGSPIK